MITLFAAILPLWPLLLTCAAVTVLILLSIKVHRVIALLMFIFFFILILIVTLQAGFKDVRITW